MSKCASYSIAIECLNREEWRDDWILLFIDLSMRGIDKWECTVAIENWAENAMNEGK